MIINTLCQKIFQAYIAMCERSGWVTVARVDEWMNDERGWQRKKTYQSVESTHQDYLQRLSNIIEGLSHIDDQTSQAKKRIPFNRAETALKNLKSEVSSHGANPRLDYVLQLIEDILRAYKSDANNAESMITEVTSHFERYLRIENEMTTADYEFAADMLEQASRLQRILAKTMPPAKQRDALTRQKVIAENILQALQRPLLENIGKCSSDNSALLEQLQQLSILETDVRDAVGSPTLLRKQKKKIRHHRRREIPGTIDDRRKTGAQVKTNLIPASQLLSSHELALLRLKRIVKAADDEIATLGSKTSEQATSSSAKDKTQSWALLSYMGSMFSSSKAVDTQPSATTAADGFAQSQLIMQHPERWGFYPRLMRAHARISDLYEAYMAVCKTLDSSDSEIALNEFLITNIYGFVRHALDPLFISEWREIYCNTLKTIEGLMQSKKTLSQIFILSGLSLAGGNLREVFATLEIASPKYSSLLESLASLPELSQPTEGSDSYKMQQWRNRLEKVLAGDLYLILHTIGTSALDSLISECGPYTTLYERQIQEQIVSDTTTLRGILTSFLLRPLLQSNCIGDKK